MAPCSPGCAAGALILTHLTARSSAFPAGRASRCCCRSAPARRGQADPMSRTARDFLHHYERPPRQPLQRWAATLLDLLDGAPAGSYEGARQRQSAMNNAALVFAYLGKTSRAGEICEYQLALVAEAVRVHRDPGSPAYLTMAVDPWVNLGRLSVLRGDAEAATSHFADIFALRSGAGRRLGPCVIPAAAWSAARRADPRLDEVSGAVYVVDSLKALFSAGKFSEAAGFVKSLGWTDATSLRWLAAEARTIALAGLERHEEVLAETAEEPDGASLYVKAIFTQHNIEARVALRQDYAGPPPTGLARPLLRGGVER